MDLYYRRQLPHWRQDQVIYFVTWRLARGQQELDSSERDLVVAAIKSFDGQRYDIAAYVVMDDHVHALLTPLVPFELKDILHSWKSFSAHQLQRKHKRLGRVWQDEYFDRIVRDDEELLQKLKYIIGNPWKRRPDIDDYAWVWPLDAI
jgi:REP element-mobilizing transposase RayT